MEDEEEGKRSIFLNTNPEINTNPSKPALVTPMSHDKFKT